MEGITMKTQISKLTIMTLIVAIVIPVTGFAQLTGQQIMQKADDVDKGKSRKTEMKMKLINKRGAERERVLTSKSADYENVTKSIMFFNAPADVKGTGFLTWDNDVSSKDDDRWLYMPAMKKTRRISGSSAKKEYFMGSDFTYEDMGNRNVNDDTHKLLREEVVDGQKCWVIESKPKNSDHIYSKVISWIRQDAYVATKVEFYDKMGSLQKTLMVSEIKKVDGFWTSHKMHMMNHQRNHQTIITINSIEYNIDVDETTFTVNALEKGM